MVLLEGRDMRYILINDAANYPYEMIGFADDIDIREVRASAYEFADYFEQAEKDDDECLEGCELEEWVVKRLLERFNATLIPWDIEDQVHL